MNQFGRIFCLSIFGESHGKGVGITLSGCPTGIPLTEEDFYKDLDKRRSGARGTTPRKEADMPQLLTGTFNGHTTGAPLTIWFENTNTRSRDYSEFQATPRPGHADFVAKHKYHNYTDYRGGGHFSGRLTLGLVSAGVVAKKILPNIHIKSQLIEVGGEKEWTKVLDEAIANGDSLGGIVEVRANGLPIGLGDPFFYSVESMISHLAFSVPAIKGIEFGSGFDSARMKGSQHNDCFVTADGKTATNYAGGINGGITNGNELVFRMVVKPTSSISLAQETYNFDLEKKNPLKVAGRHDVCIALRVPIVAEAITAIALVDLMLVRKAQM